MFFTKKGLTVLLCLLAFVCFIQCSDNIIAGNTSDVGNVKGKLTKTNGSPAAGVTVYFYPVNNNPREGLAKRMAAVDSTTTDADGNYADSLADGTYNLIAGDDTTGAYEDSITIAGDTATVSDTLKPFGSVAGVIKLQPGDDARTVFILAIGTNKWTAPTNAAGDFSLASMAEGRYPVRFLSTLDKYEPLDTFLTVQAGTDLILPDSIELPLKIPTPTGLTIHYDTLKQIVTLSWNKMDTAKVMAYNVYRKNSRVDSAEVKTTTVPIQDTVFIDSTGVQDETYIYRVSSVNAGEEEGAKTAGDTVQITSMFTATVSIIKGYATGIDGNFGGMARGVIDKSGNFYIVDNINKWLQKLSSTGNFIYKVDSFSMPISITNHSDSSLFICDHNTRKIIKTNLNGVIDTIFSTIGRPSGVCTRSDSVFISSDSGIVIHDLNGNQLNALRYSFSASLSQPNIIASDNGKLYVVEDRGAFEINFQAQTVKNIWSFSDQYANQQAMLCQYDGDTLAIITSGGNAPFFSSLYLININGALIAKCKMRYGIGGITKAPAALIGFSSDGKILSLAR
uniref:NHL repeat containing protein n=1 Tax=uncultured microorganism TaxID=358574 RepID=F8UGX5_9ZZZZ|nr:NHL repeat containing protein [uncultured microorganism]